MKACDVRVEAFSLPSPLSRSLLRATLGKVAVGFTQTPSDSADPIVCIVVVPIHSQKEEF